MKKLIPLDFSGGVNLLRDIRYVAENEVTYAKNLVPTRSGMLGKRLPRGIRRIGSSGLASLIGSFYPLALHITDIPGVDIVHANRDVSTGVAGIAVSTFDGLSGGGTLASASYTAIPTKRPAFAQLGSVVYVVAGIETYNALFSNGVFCRSGGVIQATSGGGAEIVSLTFSTTQSIAVAPRTLATYHSRMVYADFGPGMEDWIIFSDHNNPTVISQDVLSSNGRYFRLGGTTGRITAMREMMTTSTGTPTQTVLVAFKERAMYIIQGEPGQTTDTTPGPSDPPTTILGNLVVQRANTNAGCASAETIVQTPYGMLWAGPDDVWLMQEGSLPRRVGTKIRPILEATPADKRYLWHAAYFNGFYRLSVFSEGQGPGEDSPCGEQWWLDLRDNGEGQPSLNWWGPQIYTCVPGGDDVSVELTGVRMQAVDTRDGRPHALYSVEVCNNGNGSNIFAYDVANYTGRDGAAPNEGPGAAFPGESEVLAVDGSEINVELRTAELDDGDPGTTKTHQGTEVSLAPTETVYLSIENQFNGGARVTTESEAVIASGSFTTDVSALDSALVTREFKAVTLRPDEGTRPAGITIRQRIYDTPGYVIDETNDQLGFIVNGTSPTLSFSFDVTVPHGFYEDFGHMVDAITGVFANQFLATTPIPGTEAAISHNHNPFLGPRTSTVLTWTLDPNASFTLDSWGIYWRNNVFVESTDPVKMKLAAMLGVNVTLQDPVSGTYYIKSSLTDTINCDSFVFSKRSAHFELNNIIHDYRPFGRRPT